MAQQLARHVAISPLVEIDALGTELRRQEPQEPVPAPMSAPSSRP